MHIEKSAAHISPQYKTRRCTIHYFYLIGKERKRLCQDKRINLSIRIDRISTSKPCGTRYAGFACGHAVNTYSGEKEKRRATNEPANVSIQEPEGSEKIRRRTTA